jgi:hypothetical protein
MKKITYIFIATILILISGCVTFDSKANTFPLMYEKKPSNILILPPINLSTAPEAKEYFMSTLSEAASATGYYFFPLEVTTHFLKTEGLYDTEIISDDLLPQFKEYFNADAVLITKITEWDKSYYVIGGNVTVSLDFALRSTVSGETLWNYKGRIVYDTTGDSGGGLLIALLETAVKTAAQDYVPIAKAINKQVLETVPFGKYHPRNNQDQADQVKILSEDKQ